MRKSKIGKQQYYTSETSSLIGKNARDRYVDGHHGGRYSQSAKWIIPLFFNAARRESTGLWPWYLLGNSKKNWGEYLEAL